jgi:DNA-binding NarL/FixJ family response regulator
MKLIKIMLVDDHTLVREGLKLIIERNMDLKVIDEACNGEEAIKKAKLLKPDIIIMDINMPILNGLDSLKRMKEIGIASKVIILTAYLNRDYIISATKIGAKGYLIKDAKPDKLIMAIREVSLGRSFIDEKVANVLAYGGNDKFENVESELEKVKLLTKREYEVLVLLSAGLDNKAIGRELYISEKTVKNHITNIFKKIGVNDRVQATIFTYNNIKK